MNTQGIAVKIFKNPDQGINFAKKELYRDLTPQSILFLSGGNTPKPLYKKLAEEKKLHCGALALVDERFGEPFHENSNAYLIRESGIVDFISVLHPGKTLKESAEFYNGEIEKLFVRFPHKVAIMGIGEDGHTAGIPARVQNSKLKIQNDRLVKAFEDFPGQFPQRISLTFAALSQMDLIILLVFGEGKKKALEEMFRNGSEEEIPARFYARPDIAQKTLLITDQTV